MFCLQCGAKIDDDVRFCPECGANQLRGDALHHAGPDSSAPKSPSPSDTAPFSMPVYTTPRADGSKDIKLLQRIGVAVAAIGVIAGLALIVPTFLADLPSQPSSGNEVTADDGQPEQAGQPEQPKEAAQDEQPAQEEPAEQDEPADEEVVDQDDGGTTSTDEDPSQLTGDGIVLLNSFETTGNYNDASHAFELFSQAAGLGDVEAEYYLGYCYFYGCGTTKDYDQAYDHFLSAANEGDALAQTMVGKCLYNGYGTTQNHEACYDWFVKAAEEGVPSAENGLGNCYKHGYGVEKDLDKMIYWYQLAADAGEDNALVNLGACYYEGLGVERNLRRAIELYHRSADRGNSLAQFYLAECYRDGDGVPRGYDLARYYAEEAVNNPRDERAREDARALLAGL